MLLDVLLAQSIASPSPKASNCDHDAAIVKADYPHVSASTFGGGPLAATVLVVVEPDGSIKRASISKSSGDLDFDMASIRAAKASKYSPRVVNCEPVEAAVPFQTTLTPSWAPGGTPSPRPH